MIVKWTLIKTPKEWRKKRRVTQDGMAKMLGISRAAYSNIENGKAVPNFGTILMMNHLMKQEESLEKYGNLETYTTFKIGDMYEVIVEEE